MPEVDDFDIVPDDEGTASQRSPWLWVILIAVVALFAFGVGAAFTMLNSRVGTVATAPTTSPTVAPTVAPVAALTITVPLAATPTLAASLTPTGTPTGTPSGTPTVTPTPSPTPFCTVALESPFVPLYAEDEFGCAHRPGATTWAAYQAFEGGFMLWRSDTDTAYVFYANGNWFPVQERWNGASALDRGAPPPGLVTPERGFGYIWSRRDDIFYGLGWAEDREKGFCALVQEFDRGFMLRSSAVASCTPDNLYNHATAADWSPVLIAAAAAGDWRSVPAADQPAAQGGERPAGTLTRPAPHGLYNVARLEGITLDGLLADWPPAWVPVPGGGASPKLKNALVYGADRHSGPGDLSANFQLAWNDLGLLVALRVNDEAYHSGPQGSDLWQGDSIELHFDRLLADDFTSTVADTDDYQIGIAFTDDLTALRAYRWLPFALESALELPGAVIGTERGYQAEWIIPWGVFELTLDSISTGRTYGFNLSINDNDAADPRQETILSASPARTTHNNPTEWGTVRFLP